MSSRGPPIVAGRLILKDETRGGLRRIASSITGTFKGIAKTAAGFLTRDLVRGLVNVGKESIQLGAKAETLQAGFDALKGEVDDTILSIDTLKDAVGGTVSEIDLLRAANNAMALGLPTDELNELFKAAQTVGAAMGRTTLEAVQDLTTGIGRQSKLILDNLGILVDTNAAYETYAETIGKSASELTDAERKTAFMTAAIDSLNQKAATLEGTISTTQLAQERFKASITDLKTELGQRLIPIMTDLASKFTGIASITLDSAKMIAAGDWQGAIQPLVEMFGNIQQRFIDWFGSIDWNAVFESMRTFATDLWTRFIEWAGDLLAPFLEWVRATDWNAVFEPMRTWFTNIWDKMISTAQGIQVAFTDWFNQIDWAAVMIGAYNFMASFLNTLIAAAGDIATTFINWFTEINWLDVWKGAFEWMQTFWKRFLGEAEDPSQSLTSWIGSIDWGKVFVSLAQFAAGLGAFIVTQAIMAPVTLGIKMAQWIETIDWAEVFSSVGKGFLKALGNIATAVTAWMPTWLKRLLGLETIPTPQIPAPPTPNIALPGLGGIDIAGAGGFAGIVDRPTRFLAGEAGREEVTITPITAGGGAGGMTFNFNIGTFIGLNEEAGRELAQATARFTLDELERRGVRPT